jgi:small subunit ribosomal protein S6
VTVWQQRVLLSAPGNGRGQTLARVIPWKGGIHDVREYEVTIIINPNLDDSARNEIIERVEGWLTSEDGEYKPAIHHWGQRSLAYPIRSQTEGYYVHYEVTLEPQRMNNVEREILYLEDILRHLVVRKEG